MKEKLGFCKKKVAKKFREMELKEVEPTAKKYQMIHPKRRP